MANIHETGVFKNEKREYTSTTHIIKDGKPYCGAAVPVGTSLTILSHGVNDDYLKCGRCKRKWTTHVKEGGEL